MLDTAGLPLRVGKLKREDYLSKAANFLDYTSSDLFGSDLEEGRGVSVWGDATLRTDLLALTCKAFALSGMSTRYVTLHQLVSILTMEETDLRQPLVRCNHLFVDWFEQQFPGDECPYTVRDRAIVQAFLTSRINNNKLNHYAANRDWGRLTWWATDFLDNHKQFVRSVNV